MAYLDRNTRPYSIFQQPKSNLSSTLFQDDIGFAKPIQVGLAAGYQIVVIPRHRVVANILIGIYGQMDQKNKIFGSLYFSPSIGYLFK